MRLNHTVFDLWVFRPGSAEVEYLLLHTSELKAERYFNGGRFCQIPSGVFRDDEPVPTALDRVLETYGLRAQSLWAAEHAYTIYNRRFDEVQIITVFAAAIDGGEPRLDSADHSDFRWLPYEAALAAVHYRGLKDGLRSVREYVSECVVPARELCLRSEKPTP
jgi:dATP pyrophosphohydrolase